MSLTQYIKFPFPIQRECPAVSSWTRFLSQVRRDECRAVALKGKQEGDKVAAVLGMRAMKTCNELIERAKVTDGKSMPTTA